MNVGFSFIVFGKVDKLSGGQTMNVDGVFI